MRNGSTRESPVALFRTDWVSPARTITGRDHLGVQAVSEHLYVALLPGITNVTDRARCYAFYPWFVWAFDREAKKKSADELIRLFRRAECLHTLVGINHELETGEQRPHGGDLVGRDTLVPIAQSIFNGSCIRLSQYASLDATEEDRYFKNPLGGLGQYYLGPLKDLEVLDGDAKTGLRYTAEWGSTLARLYEEGVDRKIFFETIHQDRVDRKALHSLQAFCPCHLRKNKRERDALIDLLFWRGKGDLKQELGQERRNTLLLLLDYAKRIRGIKGHFPDPKGFLASAYSRVLPDGSPWDIPQMLESAANGWSIYQRHELLAVAVQALFWAGLSALSAEGGHVRDTASYSAWFAKRFDAVLSGQFASSQVAKIIETRRASQPPHSSRQLADHELNLAYAVFEALAADDSDQTVSLATQVIVALLARNPADSGYGQFVLSDRFLETYEINLAFLHNFAARIWTEMSTREWLDWLAGKWGIQVHFRVALRKLRHQLQDTFRIVPLDDGLQVREAPPTKWSLPRLAQALRFLYDLAALDELEDVENQPWVLSALGEELLESELGKR